MPAKRLAVQKVCVCLCVSVCRDSERVRTWTRVVPLGLL